MSGKGDPRRTRAPEPCSTEESRPAGRVVVELTPEQIAEVAKATGLRIHCIETTKAGLIAMLIAAQAVQLGSSVGMATPVLVALTDQQRRDHDAMGISGSHIVFDADGGDVRFHE